MCAYRFITIPLWKKITLLPGNTLCQSAETVKWLSLNNYMIYIVIFIRGVGTCACAFHVTPFKTLYVSGHAVSPGFLLQLILTFCVSTSAWYSVGFGPLWRIMKNNLTKSTVTHCNDSYGLPGRWKYPSTAFQNPSRNYCCWIEHLVWSR